MTDKIRNPETDSPAKDLRDTFEEGFQSEAFTRDFKRYSQNFHDNESRVPGIDNDYATQDGNTQQWIGLRALATEEPQVVIPTPAHVGRAPRAHTPVDERLREGVYTALTEDQELDATDIDVEVDGGIVRLNGSVPADVMKRQVENVALGIPGVEDVQNYLTIRSRVARGPAEKKTSKR